GGVSDITESVERAEKGASMTPSELLDIALLLGTARRLFDYFFCDRKEGDVGGALREFFGRLVSDKPLETKITRAIISEDVIADEASPALAEIRRKIRAENNRIKDNLQRYVSGAFGKYLQENIVTLRNGRYVVPVKAEYKNEIKGLVHDTSASGATLFIEPLAVVDSNNVLKALEKKEEHEIERILAELSSDCALIGSALISDYYNITNLAFIFAKAQFSLKIDGTEPILNENNYLNLKKARHPLIDRKKVVPISVELGGNYSTMVITGPNTGGKTVSLKTLGLMAMMAQAGLHIPCLDSSEICIFDSILADIGDEQSIEQSLSTFSAHMVNIVDILSKISKKSLVLFDELGAGTDPTEGAALAMSIVEKVRGYGALCAATTHYAEIKAYALETEGVTNASCEFDVETLKPTYRLIIGTPGKSNAFAISAKLGIGEDIIEAAKSRISSDNKRFEQVIEELEKNRIEAERERDEAIREKREYQAFRDAEEEKLRKKTATAERELEKAQEKATSIIESARVTSEYVMQQLEAIKKQQESGRLAEALEEGRRNIRRRLKDAADEVDPVVENEDSDYTPSRPLKKGDTVLIVNLRQQGILNDNPDKNGNVTVKTGFINTKTNIKNLKLIEEAAVVTTSEKKRIAASKYQAAVNNTFTASIDLRGQLGDDAWFMTDKYLDDAIMANVKTVTLIHGKGTGALRTALSKKLKSDSRVKSFRGGIYGEGDSGVTVVELK
ncbi:MAG: endonuclease MutS2, partial [Clostridia bacterium]|nr:endonuclease MutS2 [Clostridia bacterium]